MRHFFLWCAGASPALLRQCKEGETIRQNIIGTFVALTGIFALLTSFYAFYSISDRVEVAAAGSVLWAAMIFTLDRFIVSSMKVEKKSRNVYAIPFVQVLPRLVLAVAIGLSVGVPLELFLFREEIKHHLHRVHYNRQIAEAARHDDEREAIHKRLKAECAEQHGKAILELQASLRQLEEDIRQSINGRDHTGQTTCGPHCNDLKKEHRTFGHRLADRLAAHEACMEGTGTPAGRKRQELQEAVEGWRQYEKSYEQRALDDPSILRQYQALQTISAGAGQGQPGEAGEQVNSAALFIPILLVFFEIVPVLTKFMGGASTYEVLAMQERLEAVDRAERDSMNSAAQLARLQLDHERHAAVAEHESSTYREIHGTVHDRFKAAVLERVQARLEAWRHSRELEDDIGHLEAQFSEVLRQRFGAVVGGARVPAPPVVAAPASVQPAPPPPHPAVPESTAAAPPPGSAGSPSSGAHSTPGPRRERPLVSAFIGRFIETAASKAAEAVVHLLGSWPTVLAGVPATVYGVLQFSGAAVEPLLLVPLAAGAFMAGHFWARRHTRTALAA